MIETIEPVLYLFLACVPIVAIVLPFRLKTPWRFAPLLVLLFTYVPLSLSGSYLVSNHGGNHWASEWWPHFLGAPYHAPSGRSKASFTFVGSVFWPLVILDQLFWHKTHEPSEADFG